MNKLMPILLIPCLARGIVAQGPVVAAASDTVLRPITLEPHRDDGADAAVG